MSYNFMPCTLVRQFQVLHFHVLHFQRPLIAKFREINNDWLAWQRVGLVVSLSRPKPFDFNVDPENPLFDASSLHVVSTVPDSPSNRVTYSSSKLPIAILSVGPLTVTTLFS